jgi:SAM-dependent methyltransferase
MENDDFGIVAKGYGSVKTEETPVRKWIEDPMMELLCGDLSGQNVADLACSDGHFSSKLVSLGARSICAIDLSPKMISIAKSRFSDPKLRFVAADIFEYEGDAMFDFVLSSFVTSYASDFEDLFLMLDRIAALLKPGGRLVGFCEPETLPTEAGIDSSKYGKTKKWSAGKTEMSKVDIVWHHDGQIVPFQCTGIHPSSIRKALEASNFEQVRIHRPAATQPAKDAFEIGFWDNFDAYPLFNMFTACKPR